MFYYKQMFNDIVASYQEYDEKVNREGFIEISKDEYDTAIAELIKQAEDENEVNEKTKEKRIAELEKENAALLYQVLTGEEYTDV